MVFKYPSGRRLIGNGVYQMAVSTARAGGGVVPSWLSGMRVWLGVAAVVAAVGLGFLERVCQLIRRWITVVARMTPPRKVSACLSYRVAMPRHCLRRRYPRSTVLRLA